MTMDMEPNVECSACGKTFHFYFPENWTGDLCGFLKWPVKLRVISRPDNCQALEADKETHAPAQKRSQPL